MNKIFFFFAFIFQFGLLAELGARVELLNEYCLEGEVTQKSRLLETLRKEVFNQLKVSKFQFTPEVREAYIAYAKENARDYILQSGSKISSDLLIWADSTPSLQASVYGSHTNAGEILRHLHVLYTDLGAEVFRKYHQLSLASAIVDTWKGEIADLSKRTKPFSLFVPGDPRNPVNTKDSDRELDLYDHIINFLEDRFIEVEVKARKDLPQLKYDENGIAIPIPTITRKKKSSKVEIVKKMETRHLYASDVIASSKLQKEFNEYMREKGFPEKQINCGDQLVHWNSRSMIRGPFRQEIREAYELFKSAYEAKGRLPAERDAFPSSSEHLAFLIRNYEYKFPEELKRDWPRFPLDKAPWQVMTMLINGRKPLRECEERWEAFRTTGEFKTYGQYIGNIAQQYDMQSARRLKPFPFQYRTIQMMLKDGGVCGAMAGIAANTQNALGIPTSTAGQPGHCAVVAFRYDYNSKTYSCKGMQYATGGDLVTSPKVLWTFGSDDLADPKRQRRPMVCHKAVAWAVNKNLNAFNDAQLAYRVFELLPDEQKKSAPARTLLQSGIQLSPFAIALIDQIRNQEEDAVEQINLLNIIKNAVENLKDPLDEKSKDIYYTFLQKQVFAQIAKLPIPTDPERASMVLKYLEEEGCDNALALSQYQISVHGLETVLKRFEDQFVAHLNYIQSKFRHPQTDRDAKSFNLSLAGLYKAIEKPGRSREFANLLVELSKNKETYVDSKFCPRIIPAVLTSYRVAKSKLPQENTLYTPLLKNTSTYLQKELKNGNRTLKSAQAGSREIQAFCKVIKDRNLIREWLTELEVLFKNCETIPPHKKSPKAVPDPRVITIREQLENLN